jgi:hypothetical protein
MGQVELRPGRPVNFATPLSRHTPNPEQRRNQWALGIQRLPDQSDFIFAENPLPLLIDVKYSCRLAATILGGPECGRGCDDPAAG